MPMTGTSDDVRTVIIDMQDVKGPEFTGACLTADALRWGISGPKITRTGAVLGTVGHS